MKKHWWIIGGVFVAIAFLTFKRPQADVSPDKQQLEANSRESLKLKESLQQRIAADRKNVEDSLKMAAADDAEAKMLIEFYEQHAIFLVLYPPNKIVVEDGKDMLKTLNVKGSIRDFKVILQSRSDRAEKGIVSTANFEYQQPHNTIFAPPTDTFTQLFFGIRFLHELRHAYDNIMGIEKLSEVGEITGEFAMGELRSYVLEERLLNIYSHGEFSQAVMAFAYSYPPPSDYPEHWIDDSTCNGGLPRLEKIFPKALSDAEMNTRGGIFCMAVNLKYAETLSLGEGAKIGFLLNYHRTR